MLAQINEAVSFLQNKVDIQPEFGIILGTGLGGLVKEINISHEVSYEDIPHFPVSTVESHSGKLIFGELGGKKVVAMQGRFHFYEGYTMQEVTFPVRVLKQLGIQRLFVSNASGGVNPDFEVGEIMILNDHIDFFPGNPLIGKNIDELGPRFPDMSEVYDKEMIAKAQEVAAEEGIKVSTGVYLGLTGPTLETPAEYRMIRTLGADAVGMSTVPEIIVARHMDLPCFAISIITDLGVPGKIKKVSVADVIAVASRQEPKMTTILKELITKL
ncbi:purine-nucleoside phosphorylase [Lishizhenia tianjinensis]|uniref:Purine nucleoside phosphorylase n=1 Tax=Lishizhenia tianjinensis TaxID=477690 RepID=A0A1I7AN57_9FLAO|nr:purine-nucleoside phosphorylase [Lishizhenia tianjinensis]SFT76263.1 purine-nucleoside phosphorylase [Lishizhenia tianjinensis]